MYLQDKHKKSSTLFEIYQVLLFYILLICFFFHFVHAFLTNCSALVFKSIISTTTKNTSGLIFFQNNLVIFNKDFHGIFFIYIHCFTEFDRNHHSTKVIYLSHYTSRFHIPTSL